MFKPISTFQNFLGQLILSFLIMSALALYNPLANMIGNDKENMKVLDQRIILILPSCHHRVIWRELFTPSEIDREL